MCSCLRASEPLVNQRGALFIFAHAFYLTKIRTPLDCNVKNKSGCEVISLFYPSSLSLHLIGDKGFPFLTPQRCNLSCSVKLGELIYPSHCTKQQTGPILTLALNPIGHRRLSTNICIGGLVMTSFPFSCRDASRPHSSLVKLPI